MKKEFCFSPRSLLCSLIVGTSLFTAALHADPAAAQTAPVFTDSGQVLGIDSSDVVLGDLDRDGDLDILWVGLPTSSQVWLNQGRDPATGLLSFSRTSLPGFNFVAAALADWDGDTDLDIVMVQFNPAGPPFRTYRNLGVNAAGVVQLLETGQPWGPNGCEHLALGDLDGDGLPDAFVTCPDGDQVWIGGPPGVFSDGGQSLPNGSGRRVALRDMDNDGDLDAYVSNRGSAADRVWINQGGLQGGTPGIFADSGQQPGLGRLKPPAALGDISGDGFADVVLPASAPPHIYLNQGTDPLLSAWKGLAEDTRSQPALQAVDSGVALAELDSVLGLDIALGASTGEIQLLLNDGQGLYQPGPSFGSADLTNFNKVIALGDMDGDRRNDAVIAGAGANAGRVWLNGLGGLPPVAIFGSQPAPGSLFYFPVTRPSREAVRWLWLSNIGAAPLDITRIDLIPSISIRGAILSVTPLDEWGADSDGLLQGQRVPLPYRLSSSAPLAVALKCATDPPIPPGGVFPIQATVNVYSRESTGSTESLAATYPLRCDIAAADTGAIERLIAILTGLTVPSGASSRAAAVTAATATCSDSVTLAMDQSAPHALDVQIPDAYGSGALRLTEFSGSLTVSLLPIPGVSDRCVIRVDGGTFSAPSVQLPSGIATGPNTLSFGPAVQSDGLIDLTTGSFTATASGRIVNDLFPEGILIAGFYTGTMDPASGRINVQSDTSDFVPPSTVADGSPPAITPLVSGPLGANGWYVGDVTVSWTVSDPETNLTAITGCVTAAVAADTIGRSFDCSATSAGGTTVAPTVTVRRDATPPVLSGVPANITATATGAAGATVNYALPSATDATSGSPAVNCAPPPGSIFPIATSAVTCGATDAAGNTATAGFTVTVQPAPPPGSERTICTTLGSKGLLDVDLFQFEGAAQEQVSVRLAADPAGTSSGSRAAVALFGNRLLRVDGGALPNAVAATLPASGSYHVTVAEEVLNSNKFTGAYCVTLTSSRDGWRSFRQR